GDGLLAETVVHLLWAALAVRGNLDLLSILAVREHLGLLSMHRLDRRSPERYLSESPRACLKNDREDEPQRTTHPGLVHGLWACGRTVHRSHAPRPGRFPVGLFLRRLRDRRSRQRHALHHPDKANEVVTM